ncbi:MAG: hypothetical protein R3F59_21830 [Myxococcota bacterium]
MLDLLATRPVVALVGEAGVGKTWLARHLARAARRQHPGGVRWGPPDGTSAERTLWILDPAPDELPTPGAEDRLLLCSRMPLPGVTHHRVAPLSEAGGLALLEARIRERGGAQTPGLPALVRALRGLPLALELAAFHLAGAMSAGELSAWFAAHDDLPPGPDGSTLATAVAADWGRLRPRERAVAAAMRAIPGSVAADGLAAALDAPVAPTRGALQRLCDQAMVEPAPSVEEDRRRFTLTTCARARAAAQPDPAAWDRYRRWLVPHVSPKVVSMDLASPGQRLAAAEQQGLRAVVAREGDDPLAVAEALRILEGPWLPQDPHGYATVVARCLEAGALPRAQALFLRTVLALARARTGDPDALPALAGLAASLDPAHDAPRLARQVLSRYSIAAFEANDGPRAHEAARLAIERWSEGADPPLLAALHVSAGNALRLVGDPSGAEAHFRRAVSATEHHPVLRAVALANLGLVRPVAEALALHREALALLGPVAAAFPGIRSDHAILLYKDGAYELARTEAERALVDALARDEYRAACGATLTLAHFDRGVGALDRATRRLDDTLAWPVPAGLRAELDEVRGSVLFDAGRTSRAVEVWQSALRDLHGPVRERCAIQLALGLAVLGDADGAARARAEAGDDVVSRVYGRVIAALAGGDRGAALADVAQLGRDASDFSELGSACRRAGRLLRERRRLALAADHTWFQLGGERVDLAPTPLLGRLLAALIAARAPLSVEALLAAGWPSERVLPAAGRARVYVAVRRLRVLGLEDVLLRRDGGYLLDPTVEVAVVG